MRIAFSGGGTGGHVLPNIAVIEELRRHQKNIHIFYIGQSGESIEKKICVRYKIPFFGIQAGKLRRYIDIKNVIDSFRVPIGFVQALRVLRRERPQLLFAKGGYVSVPVVLAARMLGIPVWLHESDVSPGLANKIGARFAQKIFVAFEETRHFFSQEVEIVGNPVRSTILHGNAEKGYSLTGFSKKLPVVMVLGGSMGSGAINQLVIDTLPYLEKIQVVHFTGPQKKHPIFRPLYAAFESLDRELADCYAIADVVVSRAGSGAIFETLACNKPMILIPLPKAGSRGDQLENAKACESRGWAKVLAQESISPEILKSEIQKQLRDAHVRNATIKSQRSGSAMAAQSAAKIAHAIAKFLDGE